MKQQLSRRHFLYLSAATATSGLLAACTTAVQQGTQAEGGSADAAPIELRLAEGSWIGPEGIAFWTETMIPAFEEAHPGIKVTFESAESPDYEDKLYTQAVAGDAPDVFFIWWSAGLMEEGQLLALGDYFDDEYMADYYEGNIVGQVYEDKLYGIPKYVSSVAMAYNKDLLDAAGMDYPDETWTWENYLEAYKATTNADAGEWGNYIVHQYPYHWVWANGGEWMNADLFGTKCLLNEENSLAALKFHHDQVFGSEPVAPPIGSMGNYGWSDVFSSGKIAFIEAHSWTVTNFMRQNEFNWDFIELPAAPAPSGQPSGLTFVNGYSSYSGTEHPEEAVDLIRFLTAPEQARTMCLSLLGLQPARRSIADAWDSESEGAKAGYNVAAFTNTMDVARLIPIFKDDKQIQTEIYEPIRDQIWITNELGLEEGVQLLVDRIDEHFAG